MFGRMTATPLVRLDAGKSLEVAVSELLAATDNPQIARWIQFPTTAVLLRLVPNDPESGAIYVYDRRDGVWYWGGFEDRKYSGYRAWCDWEWLSDLIYAGLYRMHGLGAIAAFHLACFA